MPTELILIVECFNCRKVGYFARKCREPHAECENCKRKGHTTIMCSSKKNINIIKVSDTAWNSYERMMSVNDHRFKRLIDGKQPHTDAKFSRKI